MGFPGDRAQTCETDPRSKCKRRVGRPRGRGEIRYDFSSRAVGAKSLLDEALRLRIVRGEGVSVRMGCMLRRDSGWTLFSGD